MLSADCHETSSQNQINVKVQNWATSIPGPVEKYQTLGTIPRSCLPQELKNKK